MARTRAVDVLVGAAAAAAGAAALAAAGAAAPGVAGGALIGASLGLARPLPAYAWAVSAAGALLAAPDGALPDVALLLYVFAAFGAGRLAPHWSGLAALPVLAGALLAGVVVEDESAVPFLLVTGAAWGAGRALRERELVAARLAARVQELEEEREVHARLSVRYERARIAAELHDIVAHAISVMVVQASAGQRVAAVDPELTAQTFAAIAGAAREAEGDMGRLVALLGGEEPVGEAPDLTLVEELVARAAGSGLDVTLRLEGTREGLPAEVVRTAYRVVQESLTNALRYAAGAPVRVLLRGDVDALAVEVVNGAARRAGTLDGAGTGNGLRGLRERVDGCGGGFEAGPAADGGWRVAARLPRRAVLARA